MDHWITLSAFALFFWGITGVTQKLSTNNISFERSFVWFGLAFLALSAAVVLVTPLDWRLTPGLVLLAALGGLLNGLGALTSFAALERGGKAAVVIPLISLFPLVTIAGACAFLGESLTLRQGVGVVIALAAVALLAQEGVPSSEKDS